jgi:hypothetical protein
MDEFSKDPTPDGPDEEANEARLQDQLQNYQRALEQEWEDGVKYSDGTLTPLEIRTKTKEILTQGVPKAVASLVYLAQHGKNETVQLNAAKYIIDKAIGKELDGIVGNPLEALLSTLNEARADSE